MVDAREYYPAYQGQLSHENDNLNQRIFWYVFSQSFLFGAYAGVVNAPQAAKNPIFARQQDVLLWALPVTAILLSGLIYPLIVISIRSMNTLRCRFEQLAGSHEVDGLPPIHGDPTLRRIADGVHQTLPPLLMAVWAVVLGFQVWG